MIKAILMSLLTVSVTCPGWFITLGVNKGPASPRTPGAGDENKHLFDGNYFTIGFRDVYENPEKKDIQKATRLTATYHLEFSICKDFINNEGNLEMDPRCFTIELNEFSENLGSNSVDFLEEYKTAYINDQFGEGEDNLKVGMSFPSMLETRFYFCGENVEVGKVKVYSAHLLLLAGSVSGKFEENPLYGREYLNETVIECLNLEENMDKGNLRNMKNTNEFLLQNPSILTTDYTYKRIVSDGVYENVNIVQRRLMLPYVMIGKTERLVV